MSKPKMKLGALLASTQMSREQLSNAIDNYSKYFSKSQSDFRGERKTYQTIGDNPMPAGAAGFTNIVTTAEEKWEYFSKLMAEHGEKILSVESTNALSGKKVPIVIDGEDFGELTSPEILRWMGMLSHKLIEMTQTVPVRADNEGWYLSKDEAFKGRKVYELAMMNHTVTTQFKEDYHPVNPNVEHLKPGVQYNPTPSQRITQVKVGESTFQRFSGESSHHERVEMKNKILRSLEVFAIALEEANNVEVIPTGLKVQKFCNFIFGTKI